MAIERITPFLWFDHQADEAAAFYTSIFPNSRVVKVVRQNPAVPEPAGKVLTVEFELDGRRYVAFNGGPRFRFTEAISLVVHCENQAEVDTYWDGLLAGGGTPIQCGWLKDRFGLFWQITPTALIRLLGDPDPARAARVMQAMMQMVKIDIAAIEQAGKA
ncbi:MAG TPA: VOC family protein [Pirellulales bacterium]|nr:VOC family protein [Pirellulales bacterium]